MQLLLQAMSLRVIFFSSALTLRDASIPVCLKINLLYLPEHYSKVHVIDIHYIYLIMHLLSDHYIQENCLGLETLLSLSELQNTQIFFLIGPVSLIGWTLIICSQKLRNQ